MSLKRDITVNIKNTNNQIIFQYPGNTLLDNIPIDLFPTIINYYHCHHPFAIGKMNKQYNGYKLMNNKECETNVFSQMFFEYYFNNNGLYALDNSLEGKYVSNSSHILCYVTSRDAYELKCEQKENKIEFTFLPGAELDKIYLESLDRYKHAPHYIERGKYMHRVGIFITDQIILYKKYN